MPFSSSSVWKDPTPVRDDRPLGLRRAPVAGDVLGIVMAAYGLRAMLEPWVG